MSEILKNIPKNLITLEIRLGDNDFLSNKS